MTKSKYMTVEEFCKMAGISRTSAYAEMKAHRLGHIKPGKRKRLISQSDASAWLAAKHSPSQLPLAPRAPVEASAPVDNNGTAALVSFTTGLVKLIDTHPSINAETAIRSLNAAFIIAGREQP